MKVVILAGGKGTRLRPYTTVFPKPLVPIDNMPIIEIIMTQLYSCGFRDVTITVGYLAELIKTYFMDKQDKFPGMSINYIREFEPTGTAGSLSFLASQNLNEPVLVMNGDVLTTLDYKKLVEFHKSQDSALTIATHKKKLKIDLGVLQIEDKHIVDYVEKPIKEYNVSMGIYVYSPRAFKHIKQGEYLDFPDLVLDMLSRNEKVLSYESSDEWLDIGRHDDLIRAQEEFSAQKKKFLPEI